MNCFNHPTAVAVGVCRSCFRGLCPECAVAVGRSLACRDACEQDVRELQELVASNVAMRGVASHLVGGSRSQLVAAAVFMLALALAFVTFGILDTRLRSFLLPMGLLFSAYAIYQVVRAVRISRVSKS